MHTRKKNRLEGYDYSTPGVYFVTICLENGENILWNRVGACIARPQLGEEHLSSIGKIVEEGLLNIPKYYSSIRIDKYVIMPNHIHLLLNFEEIGGRAMHAPTLEVVLSQTKGAITKKLGFSIWQKTYHDHVVRDEKGYQKIWLYIDQNPLKWELDCFYNPN